MIRVGVAQKTFVPNYLFGTDYVPNWHIGTDYFKKARVEQSQLQTEQTFLEVVEEFKLLGVVLQSNLKWYSNTEYICKKGLCKALNV